MQEKSEHNLIKFLFLLTSHHSKIRVNEGGTDCQLNDKEYYERIEDNGMNKI